MKNFASSGKSLIFLGFLLISLLGTAVAQTFTGPGFTIVDNAGPTINSCSTVAVSGITSNVNVRSATLTNLQHTYIGDTQARIYSPSGTSFILASPPDFRECNYSGNYIFSDAGTTFIDAATTGCTDDQIVPPGTYKTSTYGNSTTNNGTATSLTGFFGTLTPAQANGDWLVCVFDYAPGDVGTVGSTGITFAALAPTASGAAVGGRVIQQNGNGIRNAQVTMVDSQGVERTAVTDGQGFYQFEDVPSGLTYFFSVSHLRYRFDQPTQVQFIGEDFSGINFVGTNSGFRDLFTVTNSSSKNQ